jgi:heat shock protein HslJ
MRALRTLAAVALAASLLATPALALAQSGADPDGASLPLARQPDGRLPLQGTPWRLQAYRNGEREAVPGPEVAAFIEFGPRFYEGSGGCSKVTGSYGVNGAALSLRPKQRADRSCAENLAIVQQAVESGLKKAAAFEVEAGASGMDDELVIYSITGAEVLRYGLDDLALLDGAEWRLESYTTDGQAVEASDEMPALLSFRPDSEAASKRRQSGPLVGSTGCNGIVAEFFRHADVISFSQLGLTDAPCTDELASQEAAMTRVLDATAIRIDLPADRLVMTSADTEERLEFLSQTPLEGTTWWLQRTAAEGATRDQRITLRLEDGLASGEGPCGPYSASYVTDGAFITFSDARGARDEGCSELRTEQALIAGLRRSVAIERGLGQLSLRDASGGVTLSFGRPFAP